MNGTFYGIGVGPGDPELLTIKAVNALRAADVVAVPESKKESGSVALDIARPHLKEGVQVITLTFPMIRDAEAKAAIRRENAEKIIIELEAGRNVAFLTLGDPMLYSTYIYLLENMQDKGIQPVSVPGIYSFAAISNLLNFPLVKGDESLAVISEMEITQWENLQTFDTIVCMKVSAYSEKLYNQLQTSTSWSFTMVTNAGKPTQSVSRNPSDLLEGVHYFTTVVLKKKVNT